MSEMNLPKSVRSLTIIGSDGVEVLFRKRKKRKISKRTKPAERAVRLIARGVVEGAQEYLDRHEKSNKKKKDGWMKDSGKNNRKAMKKLNKRVRKAMKS